MNFFYSGSVPIFYASALIHSSRQITFPVGNNCSQKKLYKQIKIVINTVHQHWSLKNHSWKPKISIASSDAYKLTQYNKATMTIKVTRSLLNQESVKIKEKKNKKCSKQNVKHKNHNNNTTAVLNPNEGTKERSGKLWEEGFWVLPSHTLTRTHTYIHKIIGTSGFIELSRRDVSQHITLSTSRPTFGCSSTLPHRRGDTARFDVHLSIFYS